MILLINWARKHNAQLSTTVAQAPKTEVPLPMLRASSSMGGQATVARVKTSRKSPNLVVNADGVQPGRSWDRHAAHDHDGRVVEQRSYRVEACG